VLNKLICNLDVQCVCSYFTLRFVYIGGIVDPHIFSLKNCTTTMSWNHRTFQLSHKFINQSLGHIKVVLF